MDFQIKGAPATHQRLIVEPTIQDDQGLHVTVRQPKVSESAARRLLNVVTLGIYTRFIENPRQWSAFKAAVSLDASLRGQPLSQAHIDTLFATYDRHRRLSKGELANVMADYERACAGGSRWIPRNSPHVPMQASQSLLSRGLHSLAQLARSLSREEQALKQQTRELKEAVHRHLTPRGPVVSEVDNRSDVSERPVDDGPSPTTAAHNASTNEQLLRAEVATEAIESVLRPGRTISSTAINCGLEAIHTQARLQGTPYGHAMVNHPSSEMPYCFDLIKTALDEQHMRQSTSGFFTVPLGLGGTLLQPENHVVNLTIDFANRKLLYLDAKAMSVEDAQDHYANTRGLKTMLSDLGNHVFGPDWELKTGLVQLTMAKQQGANDCGAFTQHFASMLVGGMSVADIERRFDANDRNLLRLRMAQDIDTHYWRRR
ncbi:MAG: hypothetical protein EBT56_13435 [Betaproteobacteria bacterium]|nr:hypothetical protein [Betaproteobacteria bacterium]